MVASARQAVSRLVLEQISKSYPSVVANDQISLRVEPGEIHAILGENGAGKSTLMKIIYGVVKPDHGRMLWNGQPVSIDNPAAARELGIGMVFQHFSLFDTLTVRENIALGLPPQTPLDTLGERIVAITQEYGMPLDPHRHVHTLSVGERQRVEIARALLGKPQLLILDEPTSVLTPRAVDQLFVTLRQLAEQGCSILYISHKLNEIRRLCHRCTVIRAGRVTGVCDPREETDASLSRLMTGAEPPQLPPHTQKPGAIRLAVRRLSLEPQHAFATPLHDLSFELHAGEILAIAGISGNGQQELLGVLSGEDTRAEPESVLLDGKAIGHRSRAWRRAQGVGLVPEERLGRATVGEMSLADNLLLSHHGLETVRYGWIRRRALRELTEGVLRRFAVRASGPDALAMSLSGGNLQKYIIGRAMIRAPEVLLVAQPTWGVDVRAAASIRGELIRLREQGCAVLVITEELDELFELADRILVMAGGRLSPALPVSQASRDLVGRWMSGLWQVEGAAHATP